MKHSLTAGRFFFNLKRGIAGISIAIALAGTIAMAQSVHAQCYLPAPPPAQVNVTITTDNGYVFGFGDQFGISSLHPGVDNCTYGDIYNCANNGAECYTVPANLNGYLYIVTWSDDGAYQGTIAQFTDDNITYILTEPLPASSPQWEVYATALDRDPCPPSGAPVGLADLNAQISIANAGTGGAGTSVTWVNPSGTGPGVGIVDFCPTKNVNAPGTPFPPVKICNIDDDAYWMWYNPNPALITDPFVAGAYPSFPPADMREYYIFRIGPLGAVLGSARNHFKTWRVDTLEVNHFVDVQDEFMADSLWLHAIEFLSNPARKDTSDIKRPDDHLNWYRAIGRDTLLQVVYENQFGVDSVFIDSVTHLLVPCRKDPHPWPDSLLGHYKAYRINGASPFARAVEIEDQFDSLPEFIDTLLPVYFLTPASKNFEPIPHPDTHYVAYEIFPKTTSAEVRFTSDQFGTYPMNVEQSELLLVPTLLISVRDSLGSIQGVKWWDKDRDCVIDNPQEYPLLSGWPIKLDPGGIIKNTNAAGYYNFTVQPGTYTVTEVHPLPSGWLQICPTPASSYVRTVGAGQTVTGLNFGNDTLQSTTSTISERDSIHCQVDSANDLHIRYWSDTRMSIRSHWDGPFTNFEVVCDSVVPIGTWGAWSYYECTWSGYMAHFCEWVTVGVEFLQESNNKLHKSGYWTLDGDTVSGLIPLVGMSVVPPLGTGDVIMTLYNDGIVSLPISELEIGVFPTVRPLSEMGYTPGAIGPVRPDSLVIGPGESWDTIISPPTPPFSLLVQGYASGPTGEAYFVTQHEHTTSCLIVMDGDVDESGSLTAADIVTLVGYVFKGGPPPKPCAANGDVNCSGSVTAADIIYMVSHVFKGGPPPCDICSDPHAMGCVP